MDAGSLYERNLTGLAELHRLLGRHAGTLIEIGGAVGSVVDDAPDYPTLTALVPPPGPDCSRTLCILRENPRFDPVALWTRFPEQVASAAAAGFTHVVLRAPAMSMALPADTISRGECESIRPEEVGAVSDAAYGNRERELERTLGRLPAGLVYAQGRRSPDGRVVSASLILDVAGDASVQYVATLPCAQRHGHGFAHMAEALAQARTRGATTSSLQSSASGERLYHKLGFHTVGHLELRTRNPRSCEELA